MGLCACCFAEPAVDWCGQSSDSHLCGDCMDKNLTATMKKPNARAQCTCPGLPFLKPDASKSLSKLLKHLNLYERVEKGFLAQRGSHLKDVILQCNKCYSTLELELGEANRQKFHHGKPSWKCRVCDESFSRRKWTEHDHCYGCDKHFM